MSLSEIEILKSDDKYYYRIENAKKIEIYTFCSFFLKRKLYISYVHYRLAVYL